MSFRIIAHNIGAADIGFPFVEDRPEIEKTVSPSAIWRTGGFSAKMRTVFGPDRTIRLCQCFVTPNDWLCQSVDILVHLGFGPTRAD